MASQASNPVNGNYGYQTDILMMMEVSLQHLTLVQPGKDRADISAKLTLCGEAVALTGPSRTVTTVNNSFSCIFMLHSYSCC